MHFRFPFRANGDQNSRLSLHCSDERPLGYEPVRGRETSRDQYISIEKTPSLPRATG